MRHNGNTKTKETLEARRDFFLVLLKSNLNEFEQNSSRDARAMVEGLRLIYASERGLIQKIVSFL